MMGKSNPFLDEEQDTPDLTSLIDCVFLLLIFFMVTTAFLSTTGINVTLPGAVEERVSAPLARNINVILREDGVIEVSGERTTIEEFVSTLQSVMSQRGSKNAILLADRSIPYKQVVKVMDLARGVGIEHIAFASE